MTSAPEPTPDQRAYTVRRAPRLTAVLAVALALSLLLSLIHISEPTRPY